MNHPNTKKHLPGSKIFLGQALFARISGNQHGAILIGIIVAVSMVASLGAAMVSLLNTSTVTQIGSLDSTKAYYLAESGGRYAIQIINNQEFGTPPYASRAAMITALNNQTFTMDDGSQFILTLSYAAPNFTLTSTGLPNTTAARKITYVITFYTPPGGSDGVDLPFTNTGGTLKSTDWNDGGGTDVESGGRLELDADGTDAFASLDWTNASSTMPDLADIWTNSDGLLSYEIQVKVDLKNDKDQIGGISFRLDTNSSSDIANHDFYGYSFVYNKSSESYLPSFVDRAGSATTIPTNTPYLIFWKQASGTRTILAQKQLSAISSGFLSSGHLQDWTSLIIRVQEQYDTSGNRENLITAYLADVNDYAIGTIHWDYSDFTLVDWGCSDAETYNCTSGPGCTCLVDTTFTSANFSTDQPDEIGLHGLGRDEIKMRDLAVRFGFDGGVRTEY